MVSLSAKPNNPLHSHPTPKKNIQLLIRTNTNPTLR